MKRHLYGELESGKRDDSLCNPADSGSVFIRAEIYYQRYGGRIRERLTCRAVGKESEVNRYIVADMKTAAEKSTYRMCGEEGI